MTNIDIKDLPRPISYRDKILLLGSCFTEHIGNAMEEMKFSILQNPNGILFDPLSVSKSLGSYILNKKYTEADLFQLNEVWHSWNHHSRFSNINASEAIRIINESQQNAHEFLKKTDWIIITLGSSFTYRLTDLAENPPVGGRGATNHPRRAVANCHRAPAQWFEKYLMETDEIVETLNTSYQELIKFNPQLHFIFTISPVRHLRDGVVDNNRSKARLIESVHRLVNKYDNIHYFPAYELVIDVLRDYRFYDVDLAHPNYMATEFVLEKFEASCIDKEARDCMEEVRKIVIARKHKAFQPDTEAHKQFLSAHLEKTKALIKKYPFLDLREEIEFFGMKEKE
ncbi:MAG TPA: GSCFA domain-containing protein [Chitinophagaceae bacterium]|nr:GSCFA domain-containing protein [Chitinophagaceae bacterium]